jgi:hypothetical protein
MPKFANRVATCFGVVVLTVSGALSSAQPADPTVGTWKLNLAKSTYSVPAPKSMTLNVAPAAKGYAITIDAIGSDGQPQKWGYTTTFDGSEVPVTGNPGIDTVVARSTGSGGIVEYKKAGKVITTTSSSISDDGKTMTVTVRVPTADGKEITIISVYDRQ